MGIRVDFLIKHVRPTGDGFTLFNTAETKAALRSLGVSDGDVQTLLVHWAAVADLDVIPDHEEVFARNAAMIAGARWTELYPTGRSTVAYLDAARLEDLSRASDSTRDVLFPWKPRGGVPVAVTINRKTQACTTLFQAEGLVVKADRDGMCFHLEDVLD